MLPKGVRSIAQLVYSKLSPGESLGSLPTTPRPRTSSTFPLASVMIQWRLLSCAGSVPTLAISTVYMKAYCPASGDDLSGQYAGLSVIRIPAVVVMDPIGGHLPAAADGSKGSPIGTRGCGNPPRTRHSRGGIQGARLEGSYCALHG